MIDAIVGPDWSRLDFTQTDAAAMGLDTYDEVIRALASSTFNSTAVVDESCRAHHAPLGTEAYCVDDTHVIRHHVTTPFFVRMALLDSLISSNYASDRLVDPDRGSFADVEVFALALHDELAGFPSLPTSAEEAPAIDVPPGVFAPACANHDTIHDTTQTYGTRIDPPGTTGPQRFFDVFSAWRVAPSAPEAVLLTEDPTRADTVCP